MVLGKPRHPFLLSLIFTFHHLYIARLLTTYHSCKLVIAQANGICNKTAHSVQFSSVVVTQELPQVLLNVYLCWWF